MSKDTLDIYWRDLGSHVKLPNTSAGWRRFLQSADSSVAVCMEATGSYYLRFAAACHAAGLTVYVVNPWQVKAFAVAQLSRVKTDRVDAKLIADFCSMMLDSLWPWRPMPDSLVAVTSLVRLGDGLLRHRVAAGNRVHALGVKASLLADEADRLKVSLSSERDRLMDTAAGVAESCSVIGPWYVALQELPGIGKVAALKVLAYSGDMRRFRSGREYASFTGLPPRLAESGSSLKRSSMSRRGSRPLRSVYYWAAVSASRSKSAQGQFYEGLIARGKRPKVAVVALANRLARAAWRVVIDASVAK